MPKKNSEYFSTGRAAVGFAAYSEADSTSPSPRHSWIMMSRVAICAQRFGCLWRASVKKMSMGYLGERPIRRARLRGLRAG